MGGYLIEKPNATENLWFQFMRPDAPKSLQHEILRTLDIIYKSRMIDLNHLLVIRKYGRLGVAPTNAYASKKWNTVMQLLNKYKVEK